MALSPTSLAAVKQIKKLAQPQQRIVFVHGNFNIVHPGHLRLLRFASECGDFLVVGVLGDRIAAGAVIDEASRLEGVAAITWVDHAFILNDPPEQFIAALRPAVVVKGKEHESQDNPERKVLESYGGQLLFGSGDVIFSSLDLIRSERELVNHSTITKPTAFLERHTIDLGKLAENLDRMRDLRIGVVGDTIVDEYIQCDPLGMSQEDPTIVVTPLVTDRFLGGASIVAAHAHGLGARKVDFFSVVGADDTGTYVAEKLKAFGVKSYLIPDASRPTTLKQRYRVGAKTMLRVSHLRQHGINPKIQRAILDRILPKIADLDILIFADFNYGVLTQDVVDAITAECQRHNVMMAADSQSSSQVGDVSRFKGMSLITPTEREARLALGNYDDGLVVIAEGLRRRTNSKNVLVTLGAEGLFVYTKPKGRAWHTDQLEALNSAPKDPAGAGDCLLVCASMCLALGRPIWESAYLGSLAAACQVGRIGNLPLTADELRIEISKGRISREGK